MPWLAPRRLVAIDIPWEKPPGRRDWLPARLGDDGRSACPLGPVGSARLVPLAAADGLIELDETISGVQTGDLVPYLDLTEG